MLKNSDYGHGALSIRLFLLRLWCTNYAIADECLRNVHLGARLPEDMTFSQKTYELDTATTVSAVQDIVGSCLSPDNVNRILAGVKAANEQGVDPAGIKAFLKRTLTKAQAAQVTEAFTSADIQNLPPGQTAWRLSNAISWVAGHEENEGRKLEMQQVSGDAMRWFLPKETKTSLAAGKPHVIDYKAAHASAGVPAPAAPEAPEAHAALDLLTPIQEQDARFAMLEMYD
jgi:hypothetical protein